MSGFSIGLLALDQGSFLPSVKLLIHLLPDSGENQDFLL